MKNRFLLEGKKKMSDVTNQEVRLLEAILFAAEDPLTLSQIQERMPQGAEVLKLLDELESFYKGRGFHLVKINSSYAFRTSPDLGEDLKLQKSEERALSRAAMEILAIVAYHQPVTRAEIESIRGVSTSKGTLDILVEIGWVKPGRRRQVPGRPLTWITTDEFMDHFGLESMTDLPGLDELKSAGLLDRRLAIETVPGTAELFEEEGE